jgi:hypothetical protein
MKSYSKQRALAQTSATSIKFKTLVAGTIISLSEIIEGEIQGGNNAGKPNDMLLCETADGALNIPVREFLKMTVENGKHYTGEDNEIMFAEKFQIKSSEDRKDRDGDLVYPVFAYNLAQEQLDNGGIDWTALKEGGIKEDNKFEPVQNYTITIL